MSDAAVAYTTDELVTWLENKWKRHGEVEDKFAAERLKELVSRLGESSKMLAASMKLSDERGIEIVDQRRRAEAAESRLGTALDALRSIDALDPRYDANEVHHLAKQGQGFAWDSAHQCWAGPNPEAPK